MCLCLQPYCTENARCSWCPVGEVHQPTTLCRAASGMRSFGPAHARRGLNGEVRSSSHKQRSASVGARCLVSRQRRLPVDRSPAHRCACDNLCLVPGSRRYPASRIDVFHGPKPKPLSSRRLSRIGPRFHPQPWTPPPSQVNSRAGSLLSSSTPGHDSDNDGCVSLDEKQQASEPGRAGDRHYSYRVCTARHPVPRSERGRLAGLGWEDHTRALERY